MAKKKLLNEAQVRRFMGLAGIKPTTVSNIISEMYTEEDPDPSDAEAPKMGDEAGEETGEEAGEEADMEMADAPAGEMEDGAREVSIEEEDIEALEMVVAKLRGEAPMEEPMEEPEVEDDAVEDPMADPASTDAGDADDAELSEVDLQLSEEEIVSEVARRVANRILKAKRAKKALDEALGRK